jgi:hypothetical protein
VKAGELVYHLRSLRSLYTRDLAAVLLRDSSLPSNRTIFWKAFADHVTQLGLYEKKPSTVKRFPTIPYTPHTKADADPEPVKQEA